MPTGDARYSLLLSACATTPPGWTDAGLSESSAAHPELLSPAEVAQIIQSCANLKHQTLLAVCYGAGLRVRRDIESAQGYLRIEQGNGAKDRHALLTPCLLKQLRHYWLKYRPQSILIYSADDRATALTRNAIQRVYRAAKNRAGIEKIGGIHSLRHAFATHQLAAGMPLHELQHLLGHQNIRSTQRYIYWLPACRPGLGKGCDLLREVLSDD
ncbi:tyrosine-type recombinase/integrase [Marinobacterium aestuariivivens]|uniref:Tyrosine-type recombinase/integrase n=1 Tax=Marinobacterium aestuariivivens TaxID=1698799 RepID=A0ABW2A5W0_9GAMM